ncbi:MAG: thermonuclease family protein [Hyphomicrobiales bacterium]|nr:thermonuclease family protein [Hyphomicrobiales bacterium]
MNQRRKLMLVATTCLLAASIPAFSQRRSSAARPPVATPNFALGGGFRRDPLPGPYPALVTHIVDGDTFEAKMRIWFGLEKVTLVRVRGIDAPELHARCAAEARGAKAARSTLRDFIGGRRVMLREVGVDKYGGRIDASVWVYDPTAPQAPPENLDGLMLAAGLVRVYHGGRRHSWCTKGAFAALTPHLHAP